jgi:hypothetical protein
LTVFKAVSGPGLDGVPPVSAIVLIGLAAVTTAAASGAIPALLVQRIPSSEALAAE